MEEGEDREKDKEGDRNKIKKSYRNAEIIIS